MTVRWGILGAGWIVQTATAQALRDAPSAHLSAVAARDISRARKLEPDRAYSDYASLINDESIDAVYIALANDQHAPWIHRRNATQPPRHCASLRSRSKFRPAKILDILQIVE